MLLNVIMFIFLNEFERKTIREIQAEGLPVNLSKIADRLGIAIDHMNNLHPYTMKNYFTHRDGFITYHPYFGFEISIRNDLPSNRYRFTLANEIAHYLLHKDTIESFGSMDRGNESGFVDRREAQSNKLAAEILMPINVINDMLKKSNVNSISMKALADMVGVTENAMRIRLRMPRNENNIKNKKNLT